MSASEVPTAEVPSGTAPPPVSAARPAGTPPRQLARFLAGRLPAYGPPVYRRRYFSQVVVFTLVLVALGGMWSEDVYRLGVLTAALISAVAAVGLYFAYSLGGLFAFSQGAFMGIGAYVSAQVAAEAGFVVGFVSAVVVSFVVALLLGVVLRKARHLYFAVGAMAFAEIMVLLFRNWTPLSGEVESGALYGLEVPSVAGVEFFTGQEVFWFTLTVTVVVLLVCALVERSPARRNALATKQIPAVAESNGVPIYGVAIVLFGFGSALAGVAGSLTAHTIGSITPDAFTVGVAINLYLMILLGGLRSMWGAVVGAFFVIWLPELLRPVQEYQTVIFSLLLLATIVVLPQGIVGTLGDLTRKAVRRARGH
ncbi:branched-chain amino acid ABC transporter permease [Blastococcus sp. SYSU D00820]